MGKKFPWILVYSNVQEKIQPTRDPLVLFSGNLKANFDEKCKFNDLQALTQVSLRLALKNPWRVHCLLGHYSYN